MNIRILSPFILIAMFFSVEICQAQILNRIKRGAERAATRVVERKVEKEMESAMERQLEKSWVSIFGEQTDAEGNRVDFGKILAGINMNADTEDAYEFKGQVTMEITGTESNGKKTEPVTMQNYKGIEDFYAGISVDHEEMDDIDEMVMIFDSKNNAYIMLMMQDGEKRSMAYSMDMKVFEEIETQDPKEDFGEVDFRKTGNTKTILGYKCDEYIAEDEEGITYSWITEEKTGIAMNLWDMDSPFGSKNMKSQKTPPHMGKMPTGSMMEMRFESKKNQSTAHYLIKDIDKNFSKTIEMAEYPNIMIASQD